MSNYRPFVPSTLLEEMTSGSEGVFNHTFNNFSLKSGSVIAVYEIENDKNITKLGPEYDVLVVEQRQDQGQASTIYKNCIATDAFGSISDFFEYKIRVADDPKEYKTTLDTDKMNGAFVLLLCLDGQSEKGVILGGLRHPGRKEILNKDSENHLEFEFNGVNFTIDKEGTLKLEYKSKTNNDGEYEDEEAGGSFIEINKDGSIVINDGNAEHIIIDKTNKTINIKSESDLTLNTDANINIGSKENANLTTEADLLLKASGKAAFISESSINVKAESQVEIIAPTQVLKADSMVQIESNMIQIKGQVVQLGAPGGTPALTLSTQFMGVGNKGLPVISTAVGPFSSSVFIGS